MRKLQVFTVLIKYISGTIKQKLCANLTSSTVVFLLAGVVILFNLKTTSGFSKSAISSSSHVYQIRQWHNKTTVWCKFDENSGSSSSFRVVIVLNMKAMGGLSKLAALAIVIKIHKRHNKTTILCQFDENNFDIFLNYRVVVHLDFKIISGPSWSFSFLSKSTSSARKQTLIEINKNTLSFL